MIDLSLPSNVGAMIMKNYYPMMTNNVEAMLSQNFKI